MTKKTTEEIEKLKEDWKHDPCWDIENTEEFEEHKEELLTYRKEQEAIWEKESQEYHAKLASKICPMSFLYVNNNPDDRGITYHNCLVEKCAWWNDANDCCTIRVLSMK